MSTYFRSKKKQSRSTHIVDLLAENKKYKGKQKDIVDEQIKKDFEEILEEKKASIDDDNDEPQGEDDEQ